VRVNGRGQFQSDESDHKKQGHEGGYGCSGGARKPACLQRHPASHQHTDMGKLKCTNRTQRGWQVEGWAVGA
jgi:hypothetical protein